MKSRFISILLVVMAATFFSGCSREAKKSKHQARGDKHFQAGEYSQAEIEYMNLIRLDPTNRVARRNLALMFLEQGRTAGPYLMTTQAGPFDPNDFEARTKYATALLSMGKRKEAREEITSILTAQPTNHEALLLLVESTSNSNELAEAEQQLNTFRPLAESSASFHVALGSAALRKRETNAAQASFQRALELAPNLAAAHLALGGIYLLNNDLTNGLAEFKKGSDLSPPRSPNHLRYTELLAASGDRDGAREFLTAAAKKAPDYLPILMRVAQVALSERRFADGDAALRSAMARDPNHIEAMFLMARLRLAQNEPEKAMLELERAAKQFPRYAPVRYQMAMVRASQNDLVAASRYLNEALAIAPDFTEAITTLADLHMRRGEPALAVQLLAKLSTDRPELSQVRLMLANAYRAAGKPELAFAIYEQFSRAFPTNSQPVYLMGLVQQQQNRPVEARKSFERVLSLSPGYLPAVEQLINLDLKEKKFEAARARAQKNLEAADPSAEPYLLLARVHLAETNAAAAETVLLKGLEIAPDSGPLKSTLSQVYVAQQKHGDALKRLHEVVGRNTNDIASWLMIAELNGAASNYVAAKTAYESALAVDPRSAMTLNNLAWLSLDKLNNFARANELAAKAREVAPQNPAIADTYGWILYKNGDYTRAMALIQEAASDRAMAELGDVQYHLGMTHYMMGEEASARVALQNALQRAGEEATWRTEAQDTLRILDLNVTNVDAATMTSLEQNAARNPKDPILLYRLAEVAAHTGDNKKAVERYEQALQLNTNLVPAMVKLAKLYSTEPRNPERAFALARRARNLEPNDPEIAHALGKLAYDAAQSAADFQWARGLLHESARRSSAAPEVLFDFALGAYAVGDVPGATEAMRKVVAAKPGPDRLEAANRFLEMQRLAANPAEASAASANVAAALQSQSNYVPALFVQGVILRQKGDYAAARDAYDQILKIYPAFTPATKPLALLYASHLKDPQKAYEYAGRAREAFPQDAEVARVLGTLAYARNEFARAALLLGEAGNAFPNDAEVFYLMGLSQYKLKQANESKRALLKALTLAANSTHAPEAKRILEELK